MENLSRLSHLVRQARPDEFTETSLGHTQQLLAAALGHNNLASYKASGDDANLLTAPHIAFDGELLERRQDALNAELLLSDVTTALEGMGARGRTFESFDSLMLVLQEDADRQVLASERVSGEVAMTNGWAPESDIELPFWQGLHHYGPGDDLVGAVDGLAVVEQDEDKVYYGHEIEVEAEFRVPRLGRRLFGYLSLRVRSARLRWGGEPTGTHPLLQQQP